MIVAVADSFNDRPNRDGLSRVSVSVDETVGPARLTRDGHDKRDKQDRQDGQEGRHGWFNLPHAAQPRAACDTVETATHQSPVTPTLLGGEGAARESLGVVSKLADEEEGADGRGWQK